MGVAEDLGWVMAIEGLVSLLKEIGCGDYLACRHPTISENVSPLLDLLKARGLLKIDRHGIRLSPAGWHLLETYRAVILLPEI